MQQIVFDKINNFCPAQIVATGLYGAFTFQAQDSANRQSLARQHQPFPIERYPVEWRSMELIRQLQNVSFLEDLLGDS